MRYAYISVGMLMKYPRYIVLFLILSVYFISTTSKMAQIVGGQDGLQQN